MSRTFALLLFCSSATLLGPTSAFAAGDAGAAKEKAATCAACHGQDGNKTIDNQYPKIAGQFEDYLAKALHDYRSGARKNLVMAGLSASLTDQDIANLAAYYAALPGEIKDLSDYK